MFDTEHIAVYLALLSLLNGRKANDSFALAEGVRLFDILRMKQLELNLLFKTGTQYGPVSFTIIGLVAAMVIPCKSSICRRGCSHGFSFC